MLTHQCSYHIKTSQKICKTTPLTVLFMMGLLGNGLIHSRPMLLQYRNELAKLKYKSTNWFLFDEQIATESVDMLKVFKANNNYLQKKVQGKIMSVTKRHEGLIKEPIYLNCLLTRSGQLIVWYSNSGSGKWWLALNGHFLKRPP